MLDDAQLMESEGFVLVVAWSPSGHRLAIGTAEGFLGINEVATGTRELHVSVTRFILALAWNPSGTKVSRRFFYFFCAEHCCR
mgnify:CR=1 FL=1